MQWNDEGIVLAARPLNENGLIVTLLTKEHGVHNGLVRGTRKHGSTCQIGNHLDATWKARLEDQLGFYTLEHKTAYASLVMDDSLKLSALTSLSSLISRTLPERDPHPQLYDGCLTFLHDLVHQDASQYLADYIELELAILGDLGYGLDLGECAAGGDKTQLSYVSPRSGRSVSKEHGLPYHAKLLKLPEFLNPQQINNTAPQKHTTISEIIDGIRLTDYFLSKHVFGSTNQTMPAARQRFVHKLEQLGVGNDEIKA
jgi:DNA repair protein RecO (recombination protein O)